VSGQIIARNFQDGADVKKGDLLFTIDPRPYQAALEQAQGQLAQAQSKLVLDQITLKAPAGTARAERDLTTGFGLRAGDCEKATRRW
jgi:multidrug resistance efflux pump